MRTFIAASILCVGFLFAAAERVVGQGAPGAVTPSPEVVRAQEARGKERYDYWCTPCHAGDPREGGRYLPGTSSLIAKYKGARPGALEDRTDLPAVYVRTVIRRGSEGMPFFRKTEISDAEMNDITAYLVRKR